ncbi:hypothetical protein Tco_0078839 [Tanacetum coccineum]
MVGSSSPDITPKEEPVTLDRPESPNLFLPATQVEFTFDEITFTTNNEVALIYPSHSNQEYFMAVSDFISKCCIKEAFTRAPNQYKEYLSEFWYTAKVLPDSKIWVSTPTGEVIEEIGITRFRNALRAQYLLTQYVSFLHPPNQIKDQEFATIVVQWGDWGKGNSQKELSPLRWRSADGQSFMLSRLCQSNLGDLIHKPNKRTREKIVPYPRFISLLLEHMAPKYDNEELTINPTQAICNLDVPVDSKAPKYSSPTEEVFPRGKSLEKRALEVDLKKENNLQNTYLSPPLKHPNPNLAIQEGHDASADFTTEADLGISAPKDSIP